MLLKDLSDSKDLLAAWNSALVSLLALAATALLEREVVIKTVVITVKEDGVQHLLSAFVFFV